MRIFYQEDTKHLIITPLRCGSSYMARNSTDFKLITLPNIYYSSRPTIALFEALFQESEKKTFIFRDPFERFLSYYNTFVFKQNTRTDKDDKSASPIRKILLPLAENKNIWEDINNSLLVIKDNYEIDWHTRPQTQFFLFAAHHIKNTSSDEFINSFEFINFDNYRKWIYLTFAKITEYKSALEENTSLTTFFDWNNFIKINNFIKDIYKRDYEIFNTIKKI